MKKQIQGVGKEEKGIKESTSCCLAHLLENHK